MNFALAGIIWALVPFLIALVSAILGYNEYLVLLDLDFNPYVQAIVIMLVSHSNWHNFNFDWPKGPDNGEGTFVFMQAFLVVYVLVGLLFLWRAKSRIRKKVF